MRQPEPKAIIQFILIALGVGIGIYFSNRSNIVHENAHKDFGSHTAMIHRYLDISNDTIIPEIINLEVARDTMSGWNLHLETKNFRFAPENVNSEHIPGQGHAHLFINGKKVARIYSNWYHIPELNFIINELEVTLNTNSHYIMINNERPVSIVLNNFQSEKKLFLRCISSDESTFR